MLDQMVREQFVELLHGETAQWDRCHRPASLKVAVTLAEEEEEAPLRPFSLIWFPGSQQWQALFPTRLGPH